MTQEKKRKRASAKSERDVATRLGGHRVTASGAGLEKGDGRVRGKFRIENKITSKPFFALKFQDWAMIHRYALGAGEEPLFHIKMGSSIVGALEVLIIRKSYFKNLFPEHEEVPAAAKKSRSTLIRASDVEHRDIAPICMSTGRLEDTDHHLIVMRYEDFLERFDSTPEGP